MGQRLETRAFGIFDTCFSLLKVLAKSGIIYKFSFLKLGTTFLGRPGGSFSLYHEAKIIMWLESLSWNHIPKEAIEFVLGCNLWIDVDESWGQVQPPSWDSFWNTEMVETCGFVVRTFVQRTWGRASAAVITLSLAMLMELGEWVMRSNAGNKNYHFSKENKFPELMGRESEADSETVSLFYFPLLQWLHLLRYEPFHREEWPKSFKMPITRIEFSRPFGSLKWFRLCVPGERAFRSMAWRMEGRNVFYACLPFFFFFPSVYTHLTQLPSNLCLQLSALLGWCPAPSAGDTLIVSTSIWLTIVSLLTPASAPHLGAWCSVTLAAIYTMCCLSHIRDFLEERRHDWLVTHFAMLFWS